MTFGEKLSALRRENHYTQEQLASLLGVSRQAISRWESNTAYPETDKLIRLSELFDCSLDYLLRDGVEDRSGRTPPDKADVPLQFTFRERKSSRTCWGMPLWHIGRNAHGVVAVGLNARGVIAVGLKARGIVSLGLLSIGLLSCGFLSLGLVSLGLVAVGALAAGSVALGVLAAGAVCLGVVSLGAVAVGDFAVGGLAVGRYFALGDRASAMIAIGDSSAAGTLWQSTGRLSAQDTETVRTLLAQNVPAWLGWARRLVGLFL